MNKRKWVFPLGLLIYGLVFLIGIAVGMHYLWQYMEDYEQSRPHTALNAYMQGLTAEHVADNSGELIGKIDHSLQSEQACRQVILGELTDAFSCAKKSKESNDRHHVYAIRCGSRIIGTMEMERCGEYTGGFQTWKVTKEEFDLSYLITQPVSITVPEAYPVYVQGNLLTKDYVTRDKIPFDLLKGLYAEYTLPYMNTYTAGPFLGEAALTVTDPQGNPVTIDEKTDMTVFLNNCTDEQVAAGDAHAKAFIQSYVDFVSCTGGNTAANYNALSAYIVPGGELEKRMKAALDGLSWVTDRGARISSITVHNRLKMVDGRYLWDVSYVVDTKDFAGSIQTTARVKLILTQTDVGLKTEAMKNG